MEYNIEFKSLATNNQKLKQSLNVLFLCSWYPSRVLPSNGDFIQRHAEAVALQHKVTVVHVITDDNLNERIEVSETKINEIRTLIAYFKPSKNPVIKFFRFIKAYKLLLKKVDYFDIMHVNKFYPVGLFAYWIKKRKNTPYIISEHHSLYHKPYCDKIGFIEKIVSKVIVKNASFICPVSEDLTIAIQKFGLKGHFYNVPNVVDIKRFRAKEKTEEVFTLLHVSSMVEIKNIDGILRVIKRLESKIDKFKFSLIGGNAEDFIKKAKKLDLNLTNILFKNQVSHKEIVTYFQKADVFLLFSLSENQPCVILESFSCGTPVISTNVGGVSENFPTDFGILIQSKNEDELLEAILKLYTDFKVASPKVMHEYVVNNFSKEQICKEFSELYFKSLK